MCSSIQPKNNETMLPPTRWSVVARVNSVEQSVRTEALECLAQQYRPVLIRYVSGKMRLAPQRAEDMVQSFFLEKIMLQDILSAATPLKGRFRSFVMKVFDNFIMSQLRAQKAIKRRPSSPDAVCIEDLPDLRSAEKTPPESFDALWARQILSQTIDLMKKRCCAGNQHILWRLFEARILSPLLDGNPPIPYETLVKHFGLRSPSEASNLLITAKRMFARMLREIVRETVSEDRETEMEIMELKRILSK